MLSLFTSQGYYQGAGNGQVSWGYADTVLTERIELIRQFYRDNLQSFRQQTLLIKLLSSCDLMQQLGDRQFVSYAKSFALSYSMNFSMTSSLSKGGVFYGEFFSKDNAELILAVDEDFNVEVAVADWKNQSAVTFLDHPKSDLQFVLPSGIQTSSESGIAIACINIPLLLLQYRCYLREFVKEKNYSPYAHEFIYRFVIPNSIKTLARISVFNRLRKMAFDPDYQPARSRLSHSIAIPDIDGRIDRELQKVIDNYSTFPTGFIKVAANTPLPGKCNLITGMALPDVAPTNQVVWLLVLSRLKAYGFLIDVATKYSVDHDPTTINQAEINDLFRTIKANTVLNHLQNVLPPAFYQDAQADLSKIMSLV